MNDKSLEILKQYDFDVSQVSRGRGGMVLETNSGTKLFLECAKPDKYYEREDGITQAVAGTGFQSVDTFVRNSENALVTEAEDGRRYMIKNWFSGRECNVKSIGEVCKAVETLAKLHTNLNKLSVCQGENQKLSDAIRGMVFVTEADENQIKKQEVKEEKQQITPLKDTYQRHMRELKLASNYLKNKRNKSEFEQIAYKNIGLFYEEAAVAVGRMSGQQLLERFTQAKENGEICHGNYNYHNVIFCDGNMAVTNFDHYKNECQITDLYQFMRKILEKYDWDMEMAYKMLDEYDRVKALSDTDLELLSVLFSFPEKFWKVINFYFNSSKSWIPRKSIEKLKTVVGQNENRLKFLETIS